MTEDFLHYLWRFQRFRKDDLFSLEGERIEILRPGFHNHQSGPDFGEAKLYLGQQLWAGQLEIHIRSSDWARHQHHRDPAYNSVVLHVVYEYDGPALRQNGSSIPTLELKGRFDENLYWRYEQLLHNSTPIPCAPQWPAIADFHKTAMLERSMIERLEEKTQVLEALLEDSRGDWNQSFYCWMAYGFGLHINREPMLMLARLCPPKIWRHQKHSRLMMEALFFGMAGFLAPSPKQKEDAYLLTLRREFAHWQRKYDLVPMEASLWKWSRLRPPAFPELRLAQWVALLSSQQELFRSFLDCDSLQGLEPWLRVSPSDYWTEHYRFGQAKAKAQKAIPGAATRKLLIINVVIPFLFLYGKRRGLALYQERALQWLSELEPEVNKITRLFAQLGYSAQHAGQSQALLQLYRRYCAAKKCLLCGIGNQLLKS